ncbi:hypothetical protein C5167_037319 [Papaver somniferum]|uniref:Uncharacterized protein n=1 Tax=Papaver somniferum TaxID=3469 RepID=A0A4Y7I9H2_PAPSO|nr:hypothetical protein C5167_037319 [Papaver somniferum]
MLFPDLNAFCHKCMAQFVELVVNVLCSGVTKMGLLLEGNRSLRVCSGCIVHIVFSIFRIFLTLSYNLWW